MTLEHTWNHLLKGEGSLYNLGLTEVQNCIKPAKGGDDMPKDEVCEWLSEDDDPDYPMMFDRKITGVAEPKPLLPTRKKHVPPTVKKKKFIFLQVIEMLENPSREEEVFPTCLLPNDNKKIRCQGHWHQEA